MSLRASILLFALFVQQLPAPFETPWFRKGTRTVPLPDGHHLTVPDGFSVNVFADKFEVPRSMALAPNGDIFLTDSLTTDGKILVLRDKDKDGVAETREVFAAGLNHPFGIAFWKNYLYVGNNDAVVRFTYKAGQTKADGAPEKIVDLPPSNAAVDQDT